MATKILRVFQEFTIDGYVPFSPTANLDFGVTLGSSFPGTTPSTYQTDDPDIEVTLTEMTDFYVWIRGHGQDWNINYTRNVRVYPDSPDINNVVMGVIIANLTGMVPYTGATENLDLGTYGLVTDFVEFNTDPTSVPTTSGTLYYNSDDETLNLVGIGSVVQQIGQELFYPKVSNQTGTTIPNGRLVMVNPAQVVQGEKLNVINAITDGSYSADLVLGLATDDISNNGMVTYFGYVRDIPLTNINLNSETWASGNILYGDPAHPGGLTKTEPTAPNHKSKIAVVTKIDANTCTLMVRPTLGQHLYELHDVYITSPSNGQALVWDSTNSRWHNATPISTLAGLSDVLLNVDLASGDLLQYNGTKWTNVTIADLGLGDVSGSGTTFTIPMWFDTKEITDSVITQVNHISPTYSDIALGSMSYVTNMKVWGDIDADGVYKMNGSTLYWFVGNANQAFNISSVANGQVLMYNSTNSKWENTNLPTPSIALGDLSNVTLDATPVDGDLIKFDALNSKWINYTPNYLTKTTNGIAGRLPVWASSGAFSNTTLYYDLVDDGKLGIGVSPSYALDVSGDINITGNYKLNGVTIDTDDISEGTTNLYYTNTRVGNYLTGAISDILTSDLTANRALISSSTGKIFPSAITSTELGYLDNVSSNIQTQLDSKLNLSGGTMTGWLKFENDQPKIRLEETDTTNKNFEIRVNFGDFIIDSIDDDFTTNRQERMRIDDLGNVGIGVNPSYKLDVAGSIHSSTDISSGNDVVVGGDVIVSGTVQDDLGNYYALYNGTTNYIPKLGGLGQMSNSTIYEMANGNVVIGATTGVGKLTIKTGVSNSNVDIVTQENGSISFSNSSSINAVPTIVSKSINNIGLYLISATPDSPLGAVDMLFDVREYDNTDFTTLTRSAFKFQRFGNTLIDIRRDGVSTFSSSVTTASYSLSGDFGVGYSLSLGIGATGATARGINFGWNTTSDVAVIGAVHNGTAWKNISLQPIGGNVGIGTTSPTSKLTISGTGTGAAIDWTNTTATTGRSYRWVSLNAGGFAIEDLTASGAERLKISSTGAATFSSSVTAPIFTSIDNYNYQGLGVYNNTFIGAGDRASALIINDIDGARYAISGGGYDLTFSKNVSGTSWATVMQFLATDATDTSVDVTINERLGIGTSPSYSLDVNGTGRFSGALTGTSATFSSSVSTGDDLYVNGNTVIGNSNVGSAVVGTTRLTLQNTTLTNSRGIGFYCNDGTQNPRAWIKQITASGSQYVEFDSTYSSGNSRADWVFSTGNVGIGTSPSYKLDVNGTGRFSSSVTAGGAISTSGTGLNASVRINNTTATTGVDWHLYSLNNGNFGLYNNTGGAYAFQVTSSGYVTINERLGIGINPTATFHAYTSGTSGVQTIVGVIGSNSLRPVLLFSESTDGDITSGMSIEYDGRLTGGDNRMYINNVAGNAIFTFMSGGELGIGTDSPSELLHLKSTGPAKIKIEADSDNVTETDNAGIILSQDGGAVVGRIGYANNSNQLEIVNEYVDSIIFGTNNQTRMSISGAGTTIINEKLGIGTSPSYKLDVNGTGRFSGNVTIGTANPYLILNRTATTNYSAVSYTTNGTNNWLAGTNVTTAGSSTNYEFYSYGASTNPVLSLNYTTGAATFSSSVTATSFLRASAGAQSNPTGGASIAIDYQTTSNLQGRIRSRDWDGAVWKNLTIEANNIILSPSGNVGIGTTNPSYKLDVNGTSRISGGLDIGSGTPPSSLYGLNVAMNGNSYILVSNNTISTFMGADTSGYGMIGTLTNHDLVLRTNNNERMRIASGGNVGIGTTNPNYKLTVYGSGNSWNVGPHANGIDLYSTGNIAPHYQTTFTWYKGVPGAGSFRMELDASGNLNVNGYIALNNAYNRKTANYTLVASDKSKIVEMNVASANTLTIPANSSVAFPIGTEIVISQYGVGQTTIAGATGVTIRSVNNAKKLSDRYAMASIVKVGTDEWYAVGNLTL